MLFKERVSQFLERETFEYADQWKNGGLVHDFRRLVVDNNGQTIDRLAEILPGGLIPPSQDTTGKVIGNWKGIYEMVEKKHKLDIPYNSVIFMHRIDDSVRTLYKPEAVDGRNYVFLFLRPDLPVLTPSDMGECWPIYTPGDDEVYSPQIISPQNFEAIVVKTGTAPEALTTFSYHLRVNQIKLFDYTGERFV